jgi:hypothetical protein
VRGTAVARALSGRYRRIRDARDRRLGRGRVLQGAGSLQLGRAADAARPRDRFVWIIALRELPDRHWALRSQYPMLVLMIGYTMVSLWILAQPIVETGAG